MLTHAGELRAEKVTRVTLDVANGLYIFYKSSRLVSRRSQSTSNAHSKYIGSRVT